MDVTPYLTFNGHCEEAFKHYEQCLGGQMGEVFRYAGTPLATQVPADWGQKVMHCTLRLGDRELMGVDVGPEGYEEPRGISLSVEVKGVANAERVFAELSEGGRVVLPLQETFWAARFGMLVDRFGVPWQINAANA